MGVRLRSTTAAALLALALTACTGNDPPPTPPTPPPTTTAATPTPTPPPAPLNATPDPKGAEVFVRYFWAVFNYTYASGNTALLRSISDKACGFCADVGRHVDGLARDEQRSAGASVRVLDVLAVPPDIAKGAIITIRLSQSAGEILSTSDQVLASSTAVPSAVGEIAMVFDGSWRVLGVDLKRPGG